MDERRVEMLAKQHGIRQKRDEGGLPKTFGAFLRRADEGTLSRLMVETTILLAASKTNPATVLRDAATAYKVNTDAICTQGEAGICHEGQSKEAHRERPDQLIKEGRVKYRESLSMAGSRDVIATAPGGRP